MRWLGDRESTNVENRRGAGGMAIGGGIGATVIGLIIYLITGNPSQLLNQVNTSQPKSQEEVAVEDKYQKFVNVVFAYTEDVWTKQFSEMGKEYEKPVLVTFDNATQSGCGDASSQTGPFYCPMDHKVYIDLSFYNDLQNKFGAKGDFAMAYVIAHEVGHHVQNLLGIADKVRKQQDGASQEEINALSVKLELQADFLAGYWANHLDKSKNIIEPGDIEDALNAAQAIGDDRLQQETQGHVAPETFTHGTSAQRMYWFKKGYTTGDLDQGNTFAEGADAFIINKKDMTRYIAAAALVSHNNN